MTSDIRFALRSLLKTPGFTAVSVLILALGIGAITIVFSAVDAVLFKELPFKQPTELYTIESAVYSQVGLFSVPEYRTYRDQNHSFSGLAALSLFNTNLVDHGEAELVQGLRISANGFQVMGVEAVVGRLLVPDDDKPDAPRVVVIGYGLWQRAFGGSPSAVGRTVSLNGQPYTIVGVLPEGFVLPAPAYKDDVCVPLRADSDPQRYIHTSLHFLRVVGRLSPGVTKAQAISDMLGIMHGLMREYPKEYEGSGGNGMTPLTTAIVGDFRPMLFTLFGLVAALLLLAGTNLAGLHLVRAIGRRYDFALRSALGASSFRLVRLAVAECLALAVVGCVAGLLLASWGLRFFQAFVPATLPRGQDLHLNSTVFVFAAVVSLIFGLIPAVAPIWMVSRVDLRDALASGGNRSTGTQRRLRYILASVQVALALTLLSCCALFVRSFWAAGSQPLGFDPSHLVTFRLSLPENGYASVDEQVRHFRQIEDRLRALPGVDQAGVVGLLPLSSGLSTVSYYPTGTPQPSQAELPSANYRLASSGYFEAMHIPILSGRSLGARDDAGHPLAIVISQALATSCFGTKDPLGQRLEVQDIATGYRTGQVVGVIGNVKQGKLEELPSQDIYVTYEQMDESAVLWNRYRSYWVIESHAPVATIESEFRGAIRAEDSSIAISAVRTMTEVADQALAPRRFTLMIVGFFSVTALILTITGIYSVIAFGVAQRTREIGVRLALGAQAEQVFRLVVRDGILIVALGAPLGLLSAFVVSRLISAQLYGVSPADPLALTAAILLVVATGITASWLPARRASRLDPIIALRAD